MVGEIGIMDALSSHWVSALAGAIGVVVGAVLTVVGGTWRARGMLATLEAQDAAAKTSIDNLKTQIEDLKSEVEDMREQIRQDNMTNDVKHKENTTEIHRLANAIQQLPTVERFNRLEDRMLDYLKQALSITPIHSPPPHHRRLPET